MHTIHIHRLGNIANPSIAGFSIQKDENVHFVCVCHTPDSTLTDSIYRMCTDHILEFNKGGEENTVHVFTDILEKINHDLDTVYLKHKKQEVSLFIGLVLENHLHFSMFGREITGMIVSEKGIEDIFTDMDTGEGHFVYDSHGDVKENESLYIFAPTVDNHIIGAECQRLSHLGVAERLQLIGERIERSNIHREGIILSITKEVAQEMRETHWNAKKIHSKREPQAWVDGIKKSGTESVKKIQSSFVHLGKNTQNWTIITGLIISIGLLYIIVTTVMQSQYQIFVPQKYRELLAEGRSKLTEATRMMDQPENFTGALNDVKEIVQTVKSAGVLKVELQLLESDLANLEKSVNKVTTLKKEEYREIFTFARTTPSVPFEIYVKEKKLFFITQESIIGPYLTGETPKEYKLPDGQKYEFSDIDTEGRIYISTDNDKIYIFDK